MSLFFIWYYSGSKMLSTSSEEKSLQDLQLNDRLIDFQILDLEV